MLTLAACGVQDACTVLGLTPLALFLRHRAKRLFRLPLSPLGRAPLHLQETSQRQRRRGFWVRRSPEAFYAHTLPEPGHH